MWKTELTTSINGPSSKIWEILVTPKLWKKVDSKHYKKVMYSASKLEVGTKGKMAAEGSQTFSFKPTKVDHKSLTLVTQSPIPLGKLTITKHLRDNGEVTKLEEVVEANGPFAKLFAKLFFEKGIADTLPAQHEAINKYIENSKK